MKICPVGAELLNADGLTDGWTAMMKLTAALLRFVNAPKNGTIHLVLDKAQHHIQETVIDTYRM